MRVISKSSDNTRQAVASEALKREQLLTKFHLLENRIKDAEVHFSEVQTQGEVTKEKTGELEKQSEESLRQIQELRREMAMLNATWKGKDYDTKIALLNNESTMHKQQLGYYDEQLAEIKTLLELKDHPTLL